MKFAFIFSILAASLTFADDAQQEVAQDGQVIVKKVVPGTQDAAEETVVETDALATQDENQK